MLLKRPYSLFFLLSLTVFLLIKSCNREGKVGTLEDIEGNIYSTLRIGEQVWMTENLKTTRFKDSSLINEVTDGMEWYNLESPAYCWYNNDSAGYMHEFGALYNYYAINTDKLCPEGWRIPNEEDFQILIEGFDPEADFARHEVSKIVGAKLKAKNNHFQSADVTASNESNFSALTGGCRSYGGEFTMIGLVGYYGVLGQENISIRNNTSSVFFNVSTSGYVGVSVRCIKK